MWRIEISHFGEIFDPGASFFIIIIIIIITIIIIIIIIIIITSTSFSYRVAGLLPIMLPIIKPVSVWNCCWTKGTTCTLKTT